MKLYSGPLSMFGAKAEIALAEKGIDFELVMVPFEMKTLYQPKHPEVARINPKQQVPVLVDGDLEIFDSTQIFEYLETIKPEPALWPADPKAKARARLLEMKADEVYFPPIVRLMGLQATPDDPAAIEARAATVRFYDEMEAHARRPAMAGGRFYLYRHRVLHGAALRRAHDRADDRRASAPAGLARSDERTAGGRASGGGDGPLSALAGPPAAALPGEVDLTSSA